MKGEKAQKEARRRDGALTGGFDKEKRTVACESERWRRGWERRVDAH